MHCPECGKKNSGKNKFCTHCGKKFEKSLKTKKEKEYVWVCDFCDQEFDIKKESDKHELTCKQNPKNRKILLGIKIPNKETIFLTTFVFLLFYFFTYLLVNSYAKTNGLKEKSIIDPFGWFLSKAEQEIMPTLTPAPIESTPTPTSKPVTQIKNTSPNNNHINCIGPDGKEFSTSMEECKKLNEKWGKPVDYIVNCTMGENCGGGSRRIKKSECDNGVCCEVTKGNWSFYSSNNQCREVQSSNSSSQTQQQVDYSSWPEVTTNGGNLILKCRGSIEAVKQADAVHMEVANLLIECLKREADQSKCDTLKEETNQKYLAFQSVVKNEKCIIWVHQ